MARKHRLQKIEDVRRQYAALPFRFTDVVEIMLITSRETRRWVIPKGWPMKGRSAHGTAALEALQEAGIRGRIAKTPIGSYRYTKRGLGGLAWPCVVQLYPMAVRVEMTAWREKDERTREWFTFLDAADLVEEPDLKSLILAFGLTYKGSVKRTAS